MSNEHIFNSTFEYFQQHSAYLTHNVSEYVQNLKKCLETLKGIRLTPV